MAIDDDDDADVALHGIQIGIVDGSPCMQLEAPDGRIYHIIMPSNAAIRICEQLMTAVQEATKYQ